MPVTNAMMGLQGAPATDTLDDRWVSNYAASVGDINPVYYDNRGPVPMPAHPAYVSHLEWDAIGSLHETQLTALTPDERVRGVHVANSTQLHRALVAGDVLQSRAQVVGVQRHRAGASMMLRIDTVDAQEKAVATSYTSTIFRGVEMLGDNVPPPSAGLPGADANTTIDSGAQPRRSDAIAITQLAPYVFSECARDYGAIHTDMKIADLAGLPGLILHGTGTIAYVMSSIVNHEAAGDPRAVRGFAVRLAGMVLCPSAMTLRVFASSNPDVLLFDALAQNGTPALSHGVVVLGERK